MSATGIFIGGPADGQVRALELKGPDLVEPSLIVQFWTIKYPPGKPMDKGNIEYDTEQYFRRHQPNADGTWDYLYVPKGKTS